MKNDECNDYEWMNKNGGTSKKAKMMSARIINKKFKNDECNDNK